MLLGCRWSRSLGFCRRFAQFVRQCWVDGIRTLPTTLLAASSGEVPDRTNPLGNMLIAMSEEPEEQHGAGTPDAFERLWTPHRMAYIKGANKPTGSGPEDGCPFCEIPK